MLTQPDGDAGPAKSSRQPLPQPTEHGDYLLSNETAVYPSKRIVSGAVVADGTYYVRLQGEFVFEGAGLKKFGSPIEAFVYLKKKNAL